ncbi:transcription termination factor Rho [Haloferula sargassicola]|uniref:Transcription termination factor Rho n=1 Tax=Haloferula sargassicola TaxID=490096 RepID=A0ABP9UPL6_9BACT
MSDENTHPSPAETAEAPPKARKAAKKAAKTAAKKAAKKTVAKKAAKKAAKKTTAKKATAKEVQGSLDLGIQEPAPKPSSPEPKPAAEESRPSNEPKPQPRPERSDEGSGDDGPVKFGRVPGGGPVAREDGGNDSQQGDNPQGERRNKRRRRRRRKKNRDPQDGDHSSHDQSEPNGQPQERKPPVLDGPKMEGNGLLELAPKGFGFLRVPSKKFEQAKDDIFVSPELIRNHALRVGQWIHGLYQEGPRGPQLVEILQINGEDPELAKRWPAFEELKAVNPSKRIAFETEGSRYTTRVVDLMSPIGRGQRGLIVSPPRSGKTTLLLHIAEAVQELHDETLHLMVLLVDERPEEVTEFRRALPGVEIYASSNDEHPRNHTRIAEMAIERAKRMVEQGKHVFLLMDSITRLARAYNGGMRGGKKRGVGSGGIMVGALETPRRLFAAARNTRDAGSLTILATALVQTNSRGDEAIFQEFKGTGNMELVLDRKVAENYIYPAVDIFKSGTRREELILPEHTLHKIHMIRRGLSGHRPVEAMERLLYFLKKFPNNPQMLLEIKG